MYLDIRIPLPASGKLTRQRIRGVTYINYEYDRVYDKERRFNIPRRATIGKLDSNGMLIPNENYHKYFPGENLPGEKPRSFRSSCLRIPHLEKSLRVHSACILCHVHADETHGCAGVLIGRGVLHGCCLRSDQMRCSHCRILERCIPLNAVQS